MDGTMQETVPSLFYYKELTATLPPVTAADDQLCQGRGGILRGGSEGAAARGQQAAGQQVCAGMDDGAVLVLRVGLQTLWCVFVFVLYTSVCMGVNPSA
jgi:hypothetical protein